jgi:uncharacterized integral membrane protein (TIGR00697 family)
MTSVIIAASTAATMSMPPMNSLSTTKSVIAGSPSTRHRPIPRRRPLSTRTRFTYTAGRMRPPPRTRPPAEFRYVDLVTATFVTVLIASNVASSAKIVDWGVSLFGVRLAFDAGTLLFPVSYIFGDVLTEVYGYHRSRRVIWTGFACLAATALVLWVVRVLPGEETWRSTVGQAAYEGVLGGMSTGGIVLASLVAYLFGEFSNSVVMARLKVATHGRWLWMRTIGSTLVGEGLDTVIFVAIASLARVFPWSAFASLVVTNYLFKVGVEAAMTPVTYRVTAVLKQLERVDWYDTDTNFNPFAMAGRRRPAPSRSARGARPRGSRTAGPSRP